MKKLSFSFLIFLCLFSCHLTKTSNSLYLMPDMSIKSDTISLGENFILNQNCGEELYFVNSCPVYFYNIELKAPIAFEEEVQLFFNKKEIDVQYCTGQISSSDIPKIEEGVDVDIQLLVADFEYSCTVPSSAFQEIKYLMFSLNFKDSEKCCNETYHGNMIMETYITISGNYSQLNKNRKACNPKYTQRLEMIQAEGQGGYPEDWFYYNDTLNGKYKSLNGKYKSVLNETDSISFELKDSTRVTLSVYNSNNVIRQEEGIWSYHKSQNIVEIDFKNEVELTENKDTINLKNYALAIDTMDASNLILKTYRIENKKIKPFELLNLKKETNQ